MSEKLIEFIIGLGGFAGLGSLIASLATLRKTGEVKTDTKELKPNHGGSFRDVLDRVAHQVDSLDTRFHSMNERMIRVENKLMQD